MKQYLHFYRVPFLIAVVLAFIVLVMTITREFLAEPSVRSNTECTTTERVFDYADVLTDEEEYKLRKLIAEKEQETACDIVIVTLNESLVDYAAQYKDKIGSVPTSKCVMVYADNFYDEHKFGFNKPYGDGTLLLDNWYREKDGHVYSWMCTTGKAEDTYSSEMIDTILDNSLEYVDSDPYGAYSRFVEDFAFDMSDFGGTMGNLISPVFILLASIVVTGIFLLANLSFRKGKKTVNEMTYVAGGRPNMRRKEDTFLHKTITQRRIETSSGSGGSGGGGHHTSSGGHSHGGGGHSR